MAKPDLICKACNLHKTQWCRKWIILDQDSQECPDFEEINESEKDTDW